MKIQHLKTAGLSTIIACLLAGSPITATYAAGKAEKSKAPGKTCEQEAAHMALRDGAAVNQYVRDCKAARNETGDDSSGDTSGGSDGSIVDGTITK